MASRQVGHRTLNVKKHRLILLVIPLLVPAIACQTVLGPLTMNSADKPTPTSSLILPTSTLEFDRDTSTPAVSTPTILQPSLTPTISNTDTPAPSATFLIPTGTPAPTDMPRDVQLDIFEELWHIIDQEYLYTDFNGLDWDAIHIEYRDLINSGLSNGEFYLLMDEMISRLGDDHSRFLTPEEVSFENAEYQGNSDYVGVGILVTAVPERNRAVILAVFPGSPADEAGLKPRDSLLAADGQLILDEYGAIRDIVRGPEGSQVTLTIQSPGEDPRQVQMPRQRITGALPLLYTMLTTESGSRIGYIQIVTFTDGTIDEQVQEALQALSDEAGLDGLILDNRLNNGGANTVMTPILSYFTSGTLGHFVSREGEHPLNIEKGEDINGSMDYPLVVLIGEGTVSYGEIFSGILKDQERAYLIGETTEGNVETLWGYDFADGSRAWIAHEMFVPYNHPDEDWEATGIVPDLFIEGNWYDFTLEDDPVIKAGVDYLEGHE